VCTTGDPAHYCNDPCLRIIAIVKNIDALMLTHVWQETEYRIVSPVVHTSNISCCKFFFSFYMAVNNFIKVGLLVFLLQIIGITENIMKRPVFYL
jgi:hypothetical protein